MWFMRSYGMQLLSPSVQATRKLGRALEHLEHVPHRSLQTSACPLHGRFSCTTDGFVKVDLCTPNCTQCVDDTITSAVSLGCDNAVLPGVLVQCNGDQAAATDCTDGSTLSSELCFEVPNDDCSPDCDCSCYEGGYACGGPDDDQAPCDLARCGIGADQFIGRYCAS